MSSARSTRGPRATSSKPTAEPLKTPKPSKAAPVPILQDATRSGLLRSKPRPSKTLGTPEPQDVKVEVPTEAEKVDFEKYNNRLKGIKPGVIMSLVMQVASSEEIVGSDRCQVLDAADHDQSGMRVGSSHGPRV